ncbi:MAG: hypothetical protein LAT57_14090, partial [Balneolales bacterium]|nr:hypothetical protein [Balneolales bacterium]
MTRLSYIRLAMTGSEGEMMRRSDHHYTGNEFRVASNPKPATILTALRGVLGEEKFNEIHRKMFEVWSFKLMSPYDWFAFIEAESGRDLSWFWRAWYYETWTMYQGIESVREGRRNTTITIRDNGDAPMPVHLTLWLANGEKVEHITDSVDVWLSGKRTKAISVPYSGVKRIEIDYHRHFPDTDRSNNVWEK